MFSPPPELKILSVLAKISWKAEIELFPYVVNYFTWKPEFASNTLWMIVAVVCHNCMRENDTIHYQSLKALLQKSKVEEWRFNKNGQLPYYMSVYCRGI